MAIVQISRIQHRKGLQQDLPALASAELGWSVDTRQLYIGNGTITEGAPTEGVTEILTQYSDLLNIGDQYIFKGSQSGYTSQTGATSLSPTTRTLQQKLDDTVSVKDFGAVGNGIIDDTLAIQRAIDQVLFGGFALNQSRLRRVINFPAGTYLISASIKLPAYVYILGAGIDRTIIQQTSSIAEVIQLKDSSSQINAAYGTLGATTVKNVTIQDITLETLSSTRSVVLLDSCDNMVFNRVYFKGTITSPAGSVVSGQNAVYAIPTDDTKDINGLKFIDCVFYRIQQGLVLNANNVKILGCDFTTISIAVYVDATLSAAETKNIKVSGCTFESITRSAIYVVADTATTRMNVISIGNYFGTVGGTGVSTVAPVITFNGSGNYSIGDTFARTDAEAGVRPRVYHASTSLNSSLDANVGLTTGMLVRGPGRQLTLSASATDANTGIVLSANTGITGAATIQYILKRPTATAYRHGSIEVIYDDTTVQYVDEYTEFPNATNFTYPGPTGVTFSVTNISSGKFKVNYTSDSSGSGTLVYSITNFL
jgi:hypothetical protein